MPLTLKNQKQKPGEQSDRPKEIGNTAAATLQDTNLYAYCYVLQQQQNALFITSIVISRRVCPLNCMGMVGDTPYLSKLFWVWVCTLGDSSLAELNYCAQQSRRPLGGERGLRRRDQGRG